MQIQVPLFEEPIRLIDFLIHHLPEPMTRNGAKNAIKEKRITVDGLLPESGWKLREGQLIEILNPEPRTIKVFPLKLNILFEDEHLAVIIKPAGFAVSGNFYKTIEHALPNNLAKSIEPDALPFPQAVHRLDAATSGLLLLAKTQKARILLGKAFEQHQIDKKYMAVVTGEIPSKGEFNSPIEGKDARTTFHVIQKVESIRHGHLSLVELIPHTGRTHQLRIHLAQAGFPILGDALYSPTTHFYKGKGLFLCAVYLKFQHPVTGEFVQFTAEIPHKFNALLQRESQHKESKKTND